MRDLTVLTEQVHRAELHGYSPVHFLKKALVSLLQRKEAIVSYTPPQAVLMRGAASYHNQQQQQQQQHLHGASDTAEVVMESGGPSVDALDHAAAQGAAYACACLSGTRAYLGSNPYASFDMCSDLHCGGGHCTGSDARHGRSSSVSAGEATSPTSCGGGGNFEGSSGTAGGSGSGSGNDFSSAAGMGCSVCAGTVAGATVQYPYVGELISLHSGHNGWPVQSEISAIVNFFVKIGVV